MECYNVISAEARVLKQEEKNVCEIFKPELTVPVSEGAEASRSHCALHVLGKEREMIAFHEFTPLLLGQTLVCIGFKQLR